MTNVSKAYKNRGIIGDQETDLLLKKADLIKDEYFRLRSKAVVTTAKVFGKRESEIARLEMSKITQVNNDLELNFTLSKKRKKGLYQYTQFLEKKIKIGEMLQSDLDAKTQKQISLEWREWQKTLEGLMIQNSESLKSIDIEDKYGKHIVEYYNYMKEYHSTSQYLFPSGKTVFGQSYIFYDNEHIHPKHLLRILKSLKHDTWMHLYRETKGAQVAKEKGRNLDAVYEVKDTLDLANESTAYNYVKRFVAKKEHS
jgi:hypothetical protein